MPCIRSFDTSLQSVFCIFSAYVSWNRSRLLRVITSSAQSRTVSFGFFRYFFLPLFSSCLVVLLWNTSRNWQCMCSIEGRKNTWVSWFYTEKAHVTKGRPQRSSRESRWSMRGTLLGGARTEMHDRKGRGSSAERPHRRDDVGSCHRPKAHCRMVQGTVREDKAGFTAIPK